MAIGIGIRRERNRSFDGKLSVDFSPKPGTMRTMLQHFSVVPQTDIKYFLCLDCESRWEEEIVEDAVQQLFCLKCGSENVFPFAKSAQGQDGGCDAECARRVNASCGSGCADCGGCGTIEKTHP